MNKIACRYKQGCNDNYPLSRNTFFRENHHFINHHSSHLRQTIKPLFLQLAFIRKGINGSDVTANFTKTIPIRHC
jgi:hypothetical protein